ncbi:uncharacterized protein J4E88_010827 [Alternaria novae-zelandiae]|uniref:uncharacterized protein n=1 Tax=Alternaria novae-zelandiae TaxID=430562 RepID=UPI0020C2B916|nr:uncharacterized protein J4E88_010827 [Alternaria novae-zelandiae]KAI4663192.1 hypothetical protein J4E88_010827 [Alternaria novae-zelandiae]
MKLSVSILTLSLSTHALAFDFALAAPIRHSERATHTITKTIYHTEVRRLSTSFKDHNVRSESLVSDSSASISDEVFEAMNGDTASSMATTFLWPRGLGGQKPTVSQLPVTGVPVSFNARQVGFVHFDDDTKRDETLHPRPNIVNRRNTDLYHIKIDLASEGYISVFMSNSTASAFCKSEVELDSEGGPKGELQLAVRNSTKIVAIPVHQEAADSFCHHFKNAEGIDSPMSGKAPGSSTATSSVSEGKTSNVTPSETTSASVSKSSKHASTVVTASETNTNDSASATSATSTDKTTSFNTFDITHEIETSKSTKYVPTEESASESGSATTNEGAGMTMSKTSKADDSSSGSEATKSSKHKSTSVTASESDLATSESATDVSSKHKTKSTASGADEDSSKTVEASGTPTVSKAAYAEPSEPEKSASPSTKAESKIPEATETEEMPKSATSVQEYGGPAIDPANPADLDTSTTPKATPAAVPVSTTTDELFTEASINSFYSYIKSFVETAPDPPSTAHIADQTSIMTTDSVNGAARRGILIAPTPALIAVRDGSHSHSTGNSMTYTSDYSWKGAVSTAIASTTASSNAAIGRLKPPSLLWRIWYPATTTKVIRSRSFSGPGEEPEQEDEGFFKIDVEDDGPTRVSSGTDAVEEETAVATKFAHKQEDKDGDDEGIDVKDGGEEEEEELPADEETVPDEEAETDEGAAGDDDPLTSTKSKASHTKTVVDEEDDSAPTTDTSTDVEEKVTSTKKKPADEDDDAEPTQTAADDDEEKATSTKTKPVEDDDEATATVASSKDVKEKTSSSKTKHAEDEEEAAPTSKATNDSPPEDGDAPLNEDDEEAETDTSANDISTSTSHKPKSTRPATSNADDDADEESATTSKSKFISATSNSNDDADEESATTSTSKSKSTHKSKTTIPSLASGVSFAFPSTTPINPTPVLNPNATPLPTPLPTPPPTPTGVAPMPTQPIIWDPDCPQISTSTLTAPNGVTTTLPMAVGLGCWRTLAGNGGGWNGGNGGNETSGANGHMIKSKAWNILSDEQNVKLGVVCWMIIGFIFFQWFIGQLQFLNGEWHLGRKFVWYILGIELLGIGRRLVERAEEAQRKWEKAERERERVERLARLGG